ncbi:unnamed protein product [Prorocentrum cordatum]|uniref:Uncharacterized protein n=1 Tax=Prorocentrum cordatum TaxID=2364126 RepID=A0ABN9Q8L6_9DINO|nr:unnamed protein product [Polarella glacialis]
MLALTQTLNCSLMGLGSGGKALGLSTCTRRKLRDIDSLFGWVKKLSRPSINKFIVDLRIEISVTSLSCVPLVAAAPVHIEVSSGSGELPAIQPFPLMAPDIKPCDNRTCQLLGALRMIDGRFDRLDDLWRSGDSTATFDSQLLDALRMIDGKFDRLDELMQKFGDKVQHMVTRADLALTGLTPAPAAEAKPAVGTTSADEEMAPLAPETAQLAEASDPPAAGAQQHVALAPATGGPEAGQKRNKNNNNQKHEPTDTPPAQDPERRNLLSEPELADGETSAPVSSEELWGLIGCIRAEMSGLNLQMSAAAEAAAACAAMGPASLAVLFFDIQGWELHAQLVEARGAIERASQRWSAHVDAAAFTELGCDTAGAPRGVAFRCEQRIRLGRLEDHECFWEMLARLPTRRAGLARPAEFAPSVAHLRETEAPESALTSGGRGAAQDRAGKGRVWGRKSTKLTNEKEQGGGGAAGVAEGAHSGDRAVTGHCDGPGASGPMRRAAPRRVQQGRSARDRARIERDEGKATLGQLHGVPAEHSSEWCDAVSEQLDRRCFRNAGQIYYGDVVESEGACVRHGQGVQILTAKTVDGEDDVMWARYKGGWKSGRMHGAGAYRWSDGSCYEGSFSEGRLHGNGAFTWPERSVYDGMWVDGEMTGQGCFLNAFDGTTMQGVFYRNSFRMHDGSWVDVRQRRLQQRAQRLRIGAVPPQVASASMPVYYCEPEDSGRGGQGLLGAARVSAPGAAGGCRGLLPASLRHRRAALVPAGRPARLHARCPFAPRTVHLGYAATEKRRHRDSQQIFRGAVCEALLTGRPFTLVFGDPSGQPAAGEDEPEVPSEWSLDAFFDRLSLPPDVFDLQHFHNSGDADLFLPPEKRGWRKGLELEVEASTAGEGATAAEVAGEGATTAAEGAPGGEMRAPTMAPATVHFLNAALVSLTPLRDIDPDAVRLRLCRRFERHLPLHRVAAVVVTGPR